MIRARATGWARLITCSAFKTFALLVHVNCMNDAVTHDTHREHGTLGINTLWPTNYCFDSKKYYRLPSSDIKTKSTRLHPLHNSKFLFKKNYWKNWFLKEFTWNTKWHLKSLSQAGTRSNPAGMAILSTTMKNWFKLTAVPRASKYGCLKLSSCNATVAATSYQLISCTLWTITLHYIWSHKCQIVTWVILPYLKSTVFVCRHTHKLLSK